MPPKKVAKKNLVCWTKKDGKVVCAGKDSFKKYKPRKPVVKKAVVKKAVVKKPVVKTSPINDIKKITEKYKNELKSNKQKILTIIELKKRFKSDKQAMRDYLRNVASDYNTIVKKFNSELKKDMYKIQASEFHEITLGTQVLQQQITSSISRRLKTINNI